MICTVRANLAGGYFPTHFLLAMNGKDDRTWQETSYDAYFHCSELFLVYSVVWF